MKRLGFVIAVVAAFLFSGCGASYKLRVVDERAQEIYLTFSKGAGVKVGDVFALYHVHQQRPSSGQGGHGAHGGYGGGQASTKELAGYVQVTQIIDETHALVKVLSGTVGEDLVVEKLKKPGE
jgi:hypothetical protein